MLSNHFSSASHVFFQSQHANLQALTRNAQRAAEKLTELNLAAAKALAAESRAAARQYLLVDSPQALLTLTLTQAQANVAKAHSYGRHLRDIVFSMRGDELAEMKIAAHKLSVLAEQAEKKLHVALAPALTLSDSAHPAPALASLPAPGLAVSSLKLAKLNVNDVSDVTDVTDFTEITEAGAASGSQADAPGPRNG